MSFSYFDEWLVSKTLCQRADPPKKFGGFLPIKAASVSKLDDSQKDGIEKSAFEIVVGRHFCFC